MKFELFKLRLTKLTTSLFNSGCWTALKFGVAPSVEHRNVICNLVIDGLIDVGANRGQFSLLSSLTHPEVAVVAIEPIPAEAETFRKIHGKRSEVILIESAVGDSAGEAVLHLSRSADSSSLLPIGRKQTDLFTGTQEVGTITVPIVRLDDLALHWSGRNHQLLKLDVQGFELQVLRGAVKTLTGCSYVYVECSEVTLYEGQALRAEVETFLNEHGFIRLGRYNEHSDGGQLIQADYLFGKATS